MNRTAVHTNERGKRMSKQLTVKELRFIAKSEKIEAKVTRRGSGSVYVSLTSENDANILNRALAAFDAQLHRMPMRFTNGFIPAEIRFTIIKAGA